MTRESRTSTIAHFDPEALLVRPNVLTSIPGGKKIGEELVQERDRRHQSTQRVVGGTRRMDWQETRQGVDHHSVTGWVHLIDANGHREPVFLAPVRDVLLRESKL